MLSIRCRTFLPASIRVGGHDRVFVRARRVLCSERLECDAQTVENPVRVVESRTFDPERRGNHADRTLLEPYCATKVVLLSLTLTVYVVPAENRCQGG
jgi:hypothetical protein